MASTTIKTISAQVEAQPSQLNPLDQEKGVSSLALDSITSPGGDLKRRTRAETILVSTSLMAALFLSALDVTIVATAVPAISQDLESSTGYVWIGASYVLANAACSPIWGKLSDIWGRKVILLTTIGIFWVGSLLCGTSVNMSMLLGARTIQGIGGGGVVTLVNVCIGDLFSVRERGFYYGLVGAVWGIASAIGPVVGGVLSSQASWRWCFYINLPISGIGIVLLYVVLKLHNPRTPLKGGLKAVDWCGSLTAIGSTVMVLLGLELGGVTHPWNSPLVICLLAFGLILASLFVLIESQYAKYPIIPLHIFASRSNFGALTTTFFHTMVSTSGSYWLPLYFQGALVTSALLSGVYILPFLMGMCIVSAASGFIIRKTGNYVFIIWAGMVLATTGFGLFTNLPDNEDFVKIIIYQAIAGIGLGPNYQSPLIALQNNVDAHEIGSATSTHSFMRQLASAMSIVIGGVVFNNAMESQQPRLESLLGQDVAQKFSGRNASSNVFTLTTLKTSESYIVRGAFAKAITTMYILFAVLSGVGLLASLLIKQKQMSREHEEHKTGLQSLRNQQNKVGNLSRGK